MTISKLAEQYNQFQHAFGQGDVLNYENMINALFSPKFKKVAGPMPKLFNYQCQWMKYSSKQGSRAGSLVCLYN